MWPQVTRGVSDCDHINYNAGSKHVDGAAEDLLVFVHDYWKQFAPIHPGVQHLFGVIFFLLWTMSTVGNTLVMVIFLK